MQDETARQWLQSMFETALSAASPLGKFDPLPRGKAKGRTIVLGAGKAAASMAAAFERQWKRPVEGLVVTRYGHGCETKHVEVVEAGHPVPDDSGVRATERIMRLAAEATEDDRIVFLGSGGMSSLLVMPADGVTLEQKREITQRLLRSGAPIEHMNSVRRALSAVKGGRLAAACYPADLTTYLISDVRGDDPAVIGSGPTVQPAELEDYTDVLRKWDVEVADDILEAMERNKLPLLKRKPKVHVIATASRALKTVAAEVEIVGARHVMLGDSIFGDAREEARKMAVIARKLAEAVTTPTVLISGGETTVTVRGKGRGGRNMEFLLALGLELEGVDGIYAIACDTDGIDGTTEHAGAVLHPDTLKKMREAGVDPVECQEQNDSERAFASVDGLVTTGPTLTNVNDFRAVLVVPAGSD